MGAKNSHPGLFSGDGLGTSNALERLLKRVRELGLSLHFADTFYDIDMMSDLVRLDAELQVSPPRAPRTAAWLEQWRQLLRQPLPGEL